MKIIADSHIPFIEDYFKNEHELILKPGRAIKRKEVHDADILLVRSVTKVNEALLKNSSVKFVGSVTAGSDHLDVDWLEKNNITWCVAEGFNAPPVADYVIAVAAAFERKNILPQYRAKVAVIGVGHVGELVAKKLRALNYQVLLCDPFRAAAEKNFKHVSLSDIQEVDMITLHVPLTTSGLHPTHHFINKDFMLRQKKGCVLLNAARGSVIHTEDLLTHGSHLIWCFDVFPDEPHINLEISERALLISPHIAGYSLQSKRRGIEMIFKKLTDCSMVSASDISLPPFPTQTLYFSGKSHHWQDIVLGIFNPMMMTVMMREKMRLPDAAHQFDQMRHDFNYRHELAYTKIHAADLLDDDLVVLGRLGVLAV